MVESAGHLNPGDAGVDLDRFRLALDELVRHVWLARWRLPAGTIRPQRVLTYPTCNIVFEPDRAALYGPSRVLSVQELSGTSWAVGLLLRPAAARALTGTPPVELIGAGESLPGAPLEEVRAAMGAAGPVDQVRVRLTAILRDWLAPAAERVDETGRFVNEACRLAEERDDILRVSELAAALGSTTRTLSRLVRGHIGVSPKWLIECRRLQRAATTLYTEPGSDLAELAASLGYSDQARFTRRYRFVLGETPDQTRRAGAQNR